LQLLIKTPKESVKDVEKTNQDTAESMKSAKIIPVKTKETTAIERAPEKEAPPPKETLTTKKRYRLPN